MSFINYLLADKLIDSDEQEVPSDAEPSYGLPFGLRIGLGKFAIEKRPVPAAWALRWAMLDPTVFKRTPVARCQEEFGVLFHHRYSQHTEKELFFLSIKPDYKSGISLRRLA